MKGATIVYCSSFYFTTRLWRRRPLMQRHAYTGARSPASADLRDAFSAGSIQYSATLAYSLYTALPVLCRSPKGHVFFRFQMHEILGLRSLTHQSILAHLLAILAE